MLKRLGAAVMVAAGAVLMGTGVASGAVTGVAIRDYAFSPQVLTVPAGATVTWTNFDSAPHTVTGSSGPVTLSSPQLAEGQSWSFTFSLPGTYSYFCAVHPTMTASVVVTQVRAASPAPEPAVTAPAGVSSSRSSPVTGAVAGARAAGLTSGASTGPIAGGSLPVTNVAAPPPAVAAEPSPARAGLPLLVLGGVVLVVAAVSTLALGARTG